MPCLTGFSNRFGRRSAPMGEFEIIARYFAPIAAPQALGLRDDAAFIAPPPGEDLVVTKDMLVEAVHFFAEDPPATIGAKALRVNLSDLAAKGAKPLGFLLGLALPSTVTEEWIAGFAQGIASDSQSYGIALLGGDTVRISGPITVSITAFGTVPRGAMVKRNSAKAGDVLYVTGCIGDAAIGLRLRLEPDAPWAKKLSPSSRKWLLDLYLVPWPRNILAEVVQHHAHAAMDVSDGFIGDLSKMMAGANLGADIRLADVPFSPATREAIALAPHLHEIALMGGDDYELLLAIDPKNEAAFLADMHDIGIPVTKIGTAKASANMVFRNEDGAQRIFTQGSFVHF
jgi:thiamine-monophosphate kinase